MEMCKKRQKTNLPKKNYDKQLNLLDPDIWDDTALIKAYDESLKLAREEVAKRIANKTNKSSGSALGPSSKKQDSPFKMENEDSSNEESVFSVGDYVRTVYSGDGIEYEAQLLHFNDEDETCYVQYMGYGNKEYVSRYSLTPTWGPKLRKQQIREARKAGFGVDPNVVIDSVEVKVGPTMKTDNIQNYMIPPPPPVPPMMMNGEPFNEETETLSAMLMSWYMSGYYTGLFQGRKMGKK